MGRKAAGGLAAAQLQRFASGLFGLAEILGGVGVLLLPLRRLAGVGLIVLLIAVFPANIYSAVAGINPMNPGGPTWVLWLRLPFQLVFCGWVYWTCLSRPQVARDS